MALLRLMTNPAVTGPDALSRRAAWERVEQLMADSRVRFLTEPDGLVPLWVAFSKRENPHHLLWTDDYVAAFAQAADAELITMDEPFLTRYPRFASSFSRSSTDSSVATDCALHGILRVGCVPLLESRFDDDIIVVRRAGNSTALAVRLL